MTASFSFKKLNLLLFFTGPFPRNGSSDVFPQNSPVDRLHLGKDCFQIVYELLLAIVGVKQSLHRIAENDHVLEVTAKADGL